MKNQTAEPSLVVGLEFKASINFTRPSDWLFCALSCAGALHSLDWLDNYLSSHGIGHWQSCEGPRSPIRRTGQPHGLHTEWLRHYLQSASDWVRGVSPA